MLDLFYSYKGYFIGGCLVKKRETKEIKTKKKNVWIVGERCLWILIVGSLLGTVLEGLYCLFTWGHWETHVVSIWGDFCLIYGVGAVIMYLLYLVVGKRNFVIQFLVSMVVLSFVELMAGLILEYGLGMRAWFYNESLLPTIKGYVCIENSLAWGLLGMLFIKFLAPFLDKIFDKIENKVWKVVSIIVAIFMVVNLTFTGIILVRYANRHKTLPPANEVSAFCDKYYNDNYMENRFIEWWFIDDEKVPGQMPRKKELRTHVK